METRSRKIGCSRPARGPAADHNNSFPEWASNRLSAPLAHSRMKQREEEPRCSQEGQVSTNGGAPLPETDQRQSGNNGRDARRFGDHGAVQSERRIVGGRVRSPSDNVRPYSQPVGIKELIARPCLQVRKAWRKWRCVRAANGPGSG